MIKFAALDLGSNSFLCLIGEGTQAGITRIISDSLEMVRLGEGLSTNRKFSRAALDRADLALRKFHQLIKAENPDKILAMATAAARDAENKDELFRLCEKYQIPLQIIEGEKEAEITYGGAQCFVADLGDDLKNIQGHHIVVDIGGRSTEIIYGEGQNVKSAKSYGIGAVSLTEAFLKAPVAAGRLLEAENFVRGKLQEYRLQAPKSFVLKAVAGTATTLAEISIGKFELKAIENMTLQKVQLDHWIKDFSRKTPDEIAANYKIPQKRADVILAGVLILIEVMSFLDCDELKVSTKGVRYGIALEMLQSL